MPHPVMHHTPWRPRLPASSLERVCAPLPGSTACTVHAGTCSLSAPVPARGLRSALREAAGPGPRGTDAGNALRADSAAAAAALAGPSHAFPSWGADSTRLLFASLPGRCHAREGAGGRGAAGGAWPRPARSPALALRPWRRTTATRTKAVLPAPCVRHRSVLLIGLREYRRGGGME